MRGTGRERGRDGASTQTPEDDEENKQRKNRKDEEGWMEAW